MPNEDTMLTVGALKPGADGEHITFCRLCEAQCGMIATVADDRIVKVVPDREHVVSEGHICIKGANMASITHDPDRVLHPLRRSGTPGKFERVSWDEALDDIAGRLKTILGAGNTSPLALYTGNPTAFATLRPLYARTFAKSLSPGTKAFSVVHADTIPKNVAQQLVYGAPLTWTFPDLEDCDFLVMLGANPLVSHMSIICEPRAREKLKAIHARGEVVVIDPRRTETARAFTHIAVRPDTDVWFVAAMIQHILAAGLADTNYLEQRTSGWRQLRDRVAAITPEVAQQHCHVDADAIRDLAERFIRARTAACYGRVGTCRGRFSTLLNVLIEAINVITGRFGVRGGWVSGIAPLKDPNAAPLFTEYDSDRRSRVGNLPIVMGLEPGGNLTEEILTPGEGQIRALFIDSGNPVASYPQGSKLAEALEQLDLLVAFDLYVTETTRHAHYILPTTSFFERDDMTDMFASNAPRPWLQYTPAVLSPLGEARHEFDIYNDLLERLGLPRLLTQFSVTNDPSPSLMDAADSMLRKGRFGDGFGERPEGFSIQKLRDEFPHGARTAEHVDAVGSWDRVMTSDKKVRLWHPVIEAEFDRLANQSSCRKDETLLLFGRRSLGSMNSWMHNVDRLVRSSRPTLLMHPDDARDRQISDGQRVKLSRSDEVTIEVEVEVSDDVVVGSVCYPHGWGHWGGWSLANTLPGANINLLASDDPADWEPASGAVHVDGIPVKVTVA
jgi:anaerobic selenocysteine-containing dehydrogenase